MVMLCSKSCDNLRFCHEPEPCKVKGMLTLTIGYGAARFAEQDRPVTIMLLSMGRTTMIPATA